MPVKAAFLLVGMRTETPWSLALRRALSTLGELHTVPEEEAFQTVAESRYDIVIVDASAVGDVPSLVSRLRAQRPEPHIVVVTASPTWQRGREALRAGAADYIRKSLDEEELRSKIQAVLDTPPPSGPS
jgi:DNA-binding NarL/FixJ family response regulator